LISTWLILRKATWINQLIFELGPKIGTYY